MSVIKRGCWRDGSSAGTDNTDREKEDGNNETGNRVRNIEKVKLLKGSLSSATAKASHLTTRLSLPACSIIANHNGHSGEPGVTLVI